MSMKSDKTLFGLIKWKKKMKESISYQFREQRRGHDYRYYREKKSGEMLKMRYVNKSESLYEMEKKKDLRLKWPKLTLEERGILNRPITIKEIEFIIEKLPKRNFQAHMASVVNSIRYLKN